ncbi:contactin-associated protein-like 4 [Cololabis saira]|uniref:contactin-associated protein-like 4 n=1 Tax=Cololabis saira TaxID=129043 RepID=UPI002AD30CF9|nr:contactin-associated protein-like 4 [Cololabis saira]
MDLWSTKVWTVVGLVALMLVSLCGNTKAEMCHSPLVSSLPASSFRSSSQLSSSHGPGFAKLNRREGAGGWSPLTSDKGQWLDLDLGRRTQITAVATQGRYGSSDWQAAFYLMFSDTGHNWKQYRQEGSIGVFPGNSNADSVVQHKLQHRVIARYVRLIPLDWNPNGRIGLRMEVYGCSYDSDTVSFNGLSSLVYMLSPLPRQTSTESIFLKFKALRNSGTILQARHQHHEHGLSLELERGKLLLLLRKGRGLTPENRHVLSLGSLLDDQHWHRVTVEHHSSHINLTVDKSTMWVQIPERFSHWDHDQISVGADQTLSSSRSSRGFHGCLENLVYNDLNLIHLAKQRDQRVTVKGNVSFSCAEPTFVAVTFLGPQSFLCLPGGTESSSSDGMSAGLQFRTWNREGLLLTFDLTHGGTAWLHLSKARLHLTLHKPGRAPLELQAGSGLNDGQWHSVDLISGRGRLTVMVDGEDGSAAQTSPSFPFSTRGQLFFGGCPAEGSSSQECTNPFRAFQGCMRLVAVDQQLVDLFKVQQRLMGNYSHLQIDMCGIIDRCSPSRCEHGGSCTQSGSTFHCNCSHTGYRGATCHSSIYEQSCEAYKHRGNTSGYYYIDVDGSGPISPQLIYCNMTEDETWTVIQHNNTELTSVRPPAGKSPYSVDLEYESDEEQLSAVIGQSERCQQEVAYHCRKSRLLNTPDGPPRSWWVGGPGGGRVQTHWGGAPPGSQQCACGLQGNCVDPKHHCNCDAHRNVWAHDSGLLTHKESLPVRSLVLGDVHGSSSESAYKVGPLLCHGDKNMWNAAFFDKERSYLHFPTLNSELSADISFLFKTTSSSGVFLENLGIRDFIRIELNSSSEVVFSLDVGNGPLEVRVDAGFPLNDDTWHHIRAERNVKEASLRVDELPAATREAPADGHIHLQLNSQLFIGGTASRQKGFRGCIRSLQLNGVTLDLEERADITPGVRAGCPGHCSSYGSLCQNHGRCVERDKGFSCDCGSSAHTGAFCHKEVSVSFKPGTSIVYNFKELTVKELNRSSGAAPSSILSDTAVRTENVSLSFRTSQSPALLLYAGSYHREYLAVLLNKQDELELRYRLGRAKEAEVLKSKVRNLADQQLHSVTVSRRADKVSLQIDQNDREEFNLTTDEFSGLRSLILGRVHDSGELDPELARVASLGFTGCLSAVLFNSISPLKVALLHPNTSPVSVTGPLLRSACSSTSGNPHTAETTHQHSDQFGSMGGGRRLLNAARTDSALIGGVIAVVIFVTLSALAITARFLYRRMDTCQNHEVKPVKAEDAPGPPENQTEYFI